MGKATCNALFRTADRRNSSGKKLFAVRNASAQNNSQIYFEFFIVFKLEKWVENKKNARCFHLPFKNYV